jgi:hypothetical protein
VSCSKQYGPSDAGANLTADLEYIASRPIRRITSERFSRALAFNSALYTNIHILFRACCTPVGTLGGRRSRYTHFGRVRIQISVRQMAGGFMLTRLTTYSSSETWHAVVLTTFGSCILLSIKAQGNPWTQTTFCGGNAIWRHRNSCGSAASCATGSRYRKQGALTQTRYHKCAKRDFGLICGNATAATTTSAATPFATLNICGNAASGLLLCDKTRLMRQRKPCGS